jgi:hypothetical protein
VDIVVEVAGRLIPIEVKLSATPLPGMAKGIRAFQAHYSESAEAGYVVHTGDLVLPLAPRVLAIPFHAV